MAAARDQFGGKGGTAATVDDNLIVGGEPLENLAFLRDGKIPQRGKQRRNPLAHPLQAGAGNGEAVLEPVDETAVGIPVDSDSAQDRPDRPVEIVFDGDAAQASVQQPLVADQFPHPADQLALFLLQLPFPRNIGNHSDKKSPTAFLGERDFGHPADEFASGDRSKVTKHGILLSALNDLAVLFAEALRAAGKEIRLEIVPANHRRTGKAEESFA